MNVGDLLSDLHSDDDHVRWRATGELGKSGPSIVDAVLEDLCHSVLDERLCQAYLFIFEQQHSLATVERLRRVIEALRTREFRVAAPVEAARALERRQARRR